LIGSKIAKPSSKVFTQDPASEQVYIITGTSWKRERRSLFDFPSLKNSSTEKIGVVADLNSEKDLLEGLALGNSMKTGK
jgi:hypothetical protein